MPAGGGGQVIGEAFVRVAPDMDGFAQSAASETEAAADGIGSKLKLALLGVGLLGGAALAKGLSEALGQDKAKDLMAAQLGATPAEAKKYGDVAGKLFTGAVTEDFAQGADAIKTIMQSGIAPPEATSAQLESISTKVLDVSTVMGEDLAKTTGAVSTMLKTGLAPNAEAALDILTKGTQNGANKAEDLLDTFTEYPTQFQKLGLDGKAAMGLLQQGLQGGARDADTVADALKEFSILAVDGSKGAAEAYKALGLDAEKMTAQIARGGPQASAGLQTVLDRLKDMKDPVAQNAASVGLFGTKAEDLGKALFKLDPKSAVKALGDVAGAADTAGDTMRDNASTKIDQFKRKITQAFVEQLGDKVIPKAVEFAREMKDKFGPSVEAAGRWARDDLVPALRDVGGWLSEHVVPAVTATGRVIRDDVVPAFRDTATWVGNNKEPLMAMAAAITIFLLPAMVVAAAGAVASAATQVGAWILTRTTATTSAATQVAAHWATIGGWIAAGARAIASGAVVVGSWILMGVQATIRAAQMAAAWIIALGPIAWVTVAVIAIAALIIRYWDQIVAGTRRAWSWVTSTVSGAWQSIKDGASSAGRWVSDKVSALSGAVTGFFGGMKRGAVEKATALWEWVRGIPQTIKDSLGDLGGLLWNAGQDIARGMLNGILSMGGEIWNTLSGWVSNAVPGPIKSALGIGSPSKVMAKEVGRWIPAGLVKGITAGSGAVEAAMRDLVPMPTMPSMTSAGLSSGLDAAVAPRANAMPATSWDTPTGRNQGGGGFHIENYHESDSGSARATAEELDFLYRGRG